MEGLPEVGFSRGFFSPQSFFNPLEKQKKHEVEDSPQNAVQANAQSVSISQESTSDYTIVTKEGDKVTISGSSRFDLSYNTYNASGRLNDQALSVSGESLSISASRELSFSVEGDLSKEELRDIQKLIRGTNKVLRDFMKGDLDKALSDTLKLGKLDSLSSFSAELTFSRTIAVSQTSLQAQLPNSDGSQPVSDAEVNPELPQQTGELPFQAEVITAEKTKSLALSIQKDIEESGVSQKKLENPLRELFNSLFDALGNQHEGKGRLLKLLGEQVLGQLKKD